MEVNEFGQVQATLPRSESIEHSNIPVLSVCPFSPEADNEDEIGERLFGKGSQYNKHIGYYLNAYAGFVLEKEIHQRGSSGGMGTWIVKELFSRGYVDAILHVRPSDPTSENQKIFQFSISTSIAEILDGSKSRYYPVEMSEVMQIVLSQERRYAIIGLPCYIKAIRLLAQQNQTIANRIHYTVALFCGHLKSIEFARMFSWQLGISPQSLRAFDFRKKILDRPANQYGIEATGEVAGKIVTKTSPVRELFGHDWGMGFFKYQACDYCDDIVGETADISVGDAWLPEYVQDSQGTNIVIVRHPLIQELIEQGILQKTLQLESITPNEIARSQAANYRHRRKGLAYRLYLAKRAKKWHPPKRIKPAAFLFKRKFRKIQDMRMTLASQSHRAFQSALKEDCFEVFVDLMVPIISKYRLIMKPTYFQKVLVRFKKLLGL